MLVEGWSERKVLLDTLYAALRVKRVLFLQFFCSFGLRQASSFWRNGSLLDYNASVVFLCWVLNVVGITTPPRQPPWRIVPVLVDLVARVKRCLRAPASWETVLYWAACVAAAAHAYPPSTCVFSFLILRTTAVVCCSFFVVVGDASC